MVDGREKEFEEKKNNKEKIKECYLVAAKRDKMEIVTEGKKLEFL